MSSSFLEKLFNTQKNLILANTKSFSVPKTYYNNFSNLKYSKNLSPRFKIKINDFYNDFIDNENNNHFNSPNKNKTKNLINNYYNTITNYSKRNNPIDIYNYKQNINNLINERHKKIEKLKNYNNKINFSPNIKIKLNYKKKCLKDYLNIKSNLLFEQTENRINKIRSRNNIYQQKKKINLNFKNNKKFNIFNKRIFGENENTFLNNEFSSFSHKIN